MQSLGSLKRSGLTPTPTEPPPLAAPGPRTHPRPPPYPRPHPHSWPRLGLAPTLSLLPPGRRWLGLGLGLGPGCGAEAGGRRRARRPVPGRLGREGGRRAQQLHIRHGLADSEPVVDLVQGELAQHAPGPATTPPQQSGGPREHTTPRTLQHVAAETRPRPSRALQSERASARTAGTSCRRPRPTAPR